MIVLKSSIRNEIFKVNNPKECHTFAPENYEVF